jgi:cell division protein FtsQ
MLMFAVVISLFAFTSKRNGERKLVKSEVVFSEGENLFISPETVNKLLIENKTHVTAIEKEQVDLNKLEKAVKQHAMIADSEVFVSIDGVLKAVIKQKSPMVRVFDEMGSFYIDSDGNKMPLSSLYAARVPIVSGAIDSEEAGDLKKLFKFIHDDEFLKKNIIGIQVYSNGAIKMMNRNFNYEIDFGRAINVETKFRNYKAFFQKAARDSSLYHYKKINLKFTQQVVCTK